jgi:hypothetical protein
LRSIAQSARQAVILTSLAAGALLATGCGDSNPTSPTVPTPAPLVKTLLEQGSAPGQPASTVSAIGFTTTKVGTLTVSVDWTFSTNQLELLVARGTNTCFQNDSFSVDFCQSDLVDSTFEPGVKPKLLVIGALPAGTYTLYVGNFGPDAESWSYQIFLTS